MSIENLTDQEKNIVAMLSFGMNAKAIGNILGYSEQTINNKLSVIYRKTGITNGNKAATVAARYTNFVKQQK